MHLKKSVKILLALSLVIVVFLLFIVFKGITNYSEGTDSTEANESSKVAEEMSYLKDTEKNFIIKEFSSDDNKYIRYIQRYVGESGGSDTWVGEESVLEKENQKGLFYGDLKVLAYPVEGGKEWSNDMYTFTIESVNETIEIPAGTFKNVVKVKTIEKGAEEYTLSYYAKGVGQIFREYVDANGKKKMTYEIEEIQDK
jgi:hypothetical protein